MIEFPNISPEIFSINVFGIHLALRWYAMAYILGLILAWRITYFAVSRPLIWPRNQAPLDPVQLEDLLTYCILGVIFGGRLGYVIFYAPDKFGVIAKTYFEKSLPRFVYSLVHQT